MSLLSHPIKIKKKSIKKKNLENSTLVIKDNAIKKMRRNKITKSVIIV